MEKLSAVRLLPTGHSFRSGLSIALLSGVAIAGVLLSCSSSPFSGSATDDGGGGGGDDGGQSGYCSGKGPPIVVGDTAGNMGKCTGDVAATAFRYGLCICQGISSGSPVTVDAFDSTRPGVTTLGTGGSVGMNASAGVSSQFSVGGDLTVGTSATINNLTVGLDVATGDTLFGQNSITIHGKARVNGDVKSNGPINITGTLTFPNTRSLMGNPANTGGVINSAVSVAPPCDCDTNSIFDISGYVAQRRTSNDNTSIGLSAAQLTNYSGDQTLNLTCGRFFLDRIGGTGKITVNVSGHTALFIGGDVNLTGPFTVNLGTTGELDLFLDGALTSSAPVNFGNKDTPARVRLYMGGSRSINLQQPSVIGANVYAPLSSMTSSALLEVYGALFIRDFNPSAEVRIHHDVAILQSGQDCGTPGTGGASPSCSRCQDCGGQACKGGSCGACANDGDCCAPLTCVNQQCVYSAG